MTLVGITGGIGSGKTTVCQMFAAMGVSVYNSDLRAREIVNENNATGNAIRRKIVRLLGAEACIGGRINNAYIATKVFADKELLASLNAIVHPAVIADFRDWATDMTEAAKSEQDARPYIILESAILFESGLERFLDRVIAVSAPVEIRIKRAVARGMNPADARERMSNQMSDCERERLADYVIRNDGSKGDLEIAVQQLDYQLIIP